MGARVNDEIRIGKEAYERILNIGNRSIEVYNKLAAEYDINSYTLRHYVKSYRERINLVYNSADTKPTIEQEDAWSKLSTVPKRDYSKFSLDEVFDVWYEDRKKEEKYIGCEYLRNIDYLLDLNAEDDFLKFIENNRMDLVTKDVKKYLLSDAADKEKEIVKKKYALLQGYKNTKAKKNYNDFNNIIKETSGEDMMKKIYGIISEYIKSDDVFVNFILKKSNIQPSIFKRKVEELKNESNENRNLITEFELIQKKRINDFAILVNNLVGKINEIIANDMSKYNILDYYLDYKMPYKDFVTSCRYLSTYKDCIDVDLLSSLSNICYPNINGTFDIHTNIVNSICTFSLTELRDMPKEKYDTYKYIYNGIPMSKEDKDNIWTFLSDRKIPICYKTVDLCFQYFVDGKLNLNNKMNKM